MDSFAKFNGVGGIAGDTFHKAYGVFALELEGGRGAAAFIAVHFSRADSKAFDGFGFKAVEVDVGEGVVVDVGVEIGSVEEALRVGGEPATEGGGIVALAKVDELGVFV